MILRKINSKIEREIPIEYKYIILFCIRKLMNRIPLEKIISKVNKTYFFYTDAPEENVEGARVVFLKDALAELGAAKNSVTGEVIFYYFRTKEINDYELYSKVVMHEFLHLVSFNKTIDGKIYSGFNDTGTYENNGINESVTDYLAFYFDEKEILIEEEMDTAYYLGMLFVELLLELGLSKEEIIKYYFENDILALKIFILNKINCNYFLLDKMLKSFDMLYSQYLHTRKMYRELANVMENIQNELKLENKNEKIENIFSGMYRYLLE